MLNKSNNEGSSFKIGPKKEAPLIRWLDIFMERYGMGYSEFMELPIPTFYALANIIVEESKEEKNRKHK